eukprot:Partr_v1_DN27411_c2_g1_i1_m71761 putative family with sequence similarity 213, member
MSTFSDVTTEQIQHIRLDLVPALPSIPVQTVTPQDLWTKSTVLFVLVRRPGCPICREAIMDLQNALRDSGVRAKYKLQVVAVIKENIEADVMGFRKYFVGDIYVDKSLEFFGAITDGKVVRNSVAGALLSPSVWKGIKRSLKKGVEMGSFAGDASVYGGLVLASSAGVHFQHNERIGEQLTSPLLDLLHSVRNAAETKHTVEKCEGGSCQFEHDETSISKTVEALP